jgi:hypothetical protein
VNIEITDIQRLTLKPGDRLIVRAPGKLSAQTAARVHEIVRVHLDLPDDVRLVVLDQGMSVEVAEGP